MQRFHLHLVSDATGETLSSVAKAALAQFEGFDAMEHMHAMIRTPKQMELALAAIQRTPGLVLYTLVDQELRGQLEEGCRGVGLLSIPVLDAVMEAFGRYLGAKGSGRPGQQHEMNAEYFGRIEAMGFTMAHDDGLRAEDMHQADIILLGDSATIVRQAKGEWTCRSAELRPYLARFREQAPHFRRLRVRHIRRAQNLAGIALERARAYESESSKF